MAGTFGPKPRVAPLRTLAAAAGLLLPGVFATSAQAADVSSPLPMAVQVTHSPARLVSGQHAEYTLTVINTSGTDSDGASLTDYLPPDVSTSGTVTGTGWDCTASTPRIVKCSYTGSIQNGAPAPAVEVPLQVGFPRSDSAEEGNLVQVTGSGSIPPSPPAVEYVTILAAPATEPAHVTVNVGNPTAVAYGSTLHNIANGNGSQNGNTTGASTAAPASRPAAAAAHAAKHPGTAAPRTHRHHRQHRGHSRRATA